ncbi:hypothetical protein NEF87_002511 [Candidatus Lokiarchaeum ossiferum]|uniref:Uncharacterized protein n=1 Tax=Candidatus Lokiarchaeum ossiferum TaxID=2951803 RepID=A0ABY6HRT8_9ARCH|nr:hypothetical protein NEF87_002511 [Candidatus Lokiarchaeum sp. B-35]
MKRKNLTIKAIRVLLALEQKPLATYDELSIITGYAKSVVFGIMKQLSSSKDHPSYFYVVGHPNLHALGLEVVDVFVHANSIEQVTNLYKICQAHPYTIVFAPCYGATNGALVQFRIPLNSKSLINDLFSHFKENNVIQDFQILNFGTKSIYTSIDVKFWDFSSFCWNFNWEEWFSFEISESKSEPKTFGKVGTVKSWLKKRDIAILAQLTDDARNKKIDMIKALKQQGYNFTPQTFSRRLKRVKDECISKYRVFMDLASFDLLNCIAILGKGKKKEIQELTQRVSSQQIPFHSVFKSEKNRFFWYLYLPTTHTADLLYHIRPKFSDIKMYYIDQPRSHLFLPWPETFNEEKEDWKVDRQFMVDDVITALIPKDESTD